MRLNSILLRRILIRLMDFPACRTNPQFSMLIEAYQPPDALTASHTKITIKLRNIIGGQEYGLDRFQREQTPDDLAVLLERDMELFKNIHLTFTFSKHPPFRHSPQSD